MSGLLNAAREVKEQGDVRIPGRVPGRAELNGFMQG